MKKRYECIGLFPLDFGDKQTVESGEVFERDFEATSGVDHESFLVRTGNIRIVEDPVPAPVKVPEKGGARGVSGTN